MTSITTARAKPQPICCSERWADLVACYRKDNAETARYSLVYEAALPIQPLDIKCPL